jgi:hypothetical protein
MNAEPDEQIQEISILNEAFMVVKAEIGKVIVG